MIAVAIIVIIAAIAVPNFSRNLDEGHIRTAQADMVGLIAVIKNEYQKILIYPTVDLTSTAAIIDRFKSWARVSEYFDFSINYDDFYSINATSA